MRDLKGKILTRFFFLYFLGWNFISFTQSCKKFALLKRSTFFGSMMIDIVMLILCIASRIFSNGELNKFCA